MNTKAITRVDGFKLREQLAEQQQWSLKEKTGVNLLYQ